MADKKNPAPLAAGRASECSAGQLNNTEHSVNRHHFQVRTRQRRRLNLGLRPSISAPAQQSDFVPLGDIAARVFSRLAEARH
jgi:hypothetical protein